MQSYTLIRFDQNFLKGEDLIQVQKSSCYTWLQQLLMEIVRLKRM